MVREAIGRVASGRAELSEDEANRVVSLMERYLPGAPLSWLVGAGAAGGRRRARTGDGVRLTVTHTTTAAPPPTK